MFNIKNLLNKFKVLVKDDQSIKDIIIKTVKDITSIDIIDKKIKIINCNVFIKEKPLYKNEIFLNKKKILFKINKKLDNIKIKNIF